MAIQPGEPTFTFNALGIEFGASAASGVYAISLWEASLFTSVRATISNADF